MSSFQIKRDIAIFKLLSNAQENPSEVIIQSSPWVIRTAKLSDIHTLSELLTESFHPPTGWLQHYLNPLLRLGIYEDLRYRFRFNSKPYTCVVAACDSYLHEPISVNKDEIVGTVELSVKQHFCAPLHSQYLYLSNLAIRADCRRQGLAGHLLESCEILAQRWGFQEIYLHVLDNNLNARALYRKHGYQIKEMHFNLLSFLFGRPKQLLLKKDLR